MSVFDRAGIPEGTVQKLEELGAILERSNPTRISARVGRVVGGPVGAGLAGGGAVEALSLALSHSLASIPWAGGAATIGYGANRLLGKLMTEPVALDYFVRAAQRLAPAAAAQAARKDKKEGGDE